jgi:hypothetical protein
MPVAALEGSQGVYRPVFFLDPSRDCIILQDSFNPEIVADRAAVRPPHGLNFLPRSHSYTGVSITPKLMKSRQIISGTVYSKYLAISTRRKPAPVNMSEYWEQGTADAGSESLTTLLNRFKPAKALI